MSYTIYPDLFQIRSRCIISYQDPAYFNNTRNQDGKKPIKIELKNTFTQSARKLMEKTINKWSYTHEGNNVQWSFITLTISSKMDHSINHYKLIKQWIENIEYRYEKINYVWKAEYQKNGNLHYHLMIDRAIEWKIVRKQWNKAQSIYVDKYQEKMKLKYKKGFFYDTEMRDSKGNSIDEETQKRRYDKGNRANWRNPNSTDVKIITEEKEIGGYISKYISKTEEEETEVKEKTFRFWGCSDTLRLLRYATITEEKIGIELRESLRKSIIKHIEDNGKIKCTIHEKPKNTIIEEAERQIKEENQRLLIEGKRQKDKLINKEISLYDMLFGR